MIIVIRNMWENLAVQSGSDTKSIPTENTVLASGTTYRLPGTLVLSKTIKYWTENPSIGLVNTERPSTFTNDSQL